MVTEDGSNSSACKGRICGYDGARAARVERLCGPVRVGMSSESLQVHVHTKRARRAQVGKDQKAQAFLGMLDNDPVVGNMLDATSYYELEAEEYARKGVNLTPDVWMVKLMVGAIDPTFDQQD